VVAVVDQDEELGKSGADSFEADVGSMEGGHSVSSDSFFDVTLGFMSEEQMVSTGSAVDADDMLEDADLNIGSADLARHDLEIIPHASHSFEHGSDGDDAVDSNAVPLSISVPQIVLTSRVTGIVHSVPTPYGCVDKGYTHIYILHIVYWSAVGSGASIVSIMEGVSLFGATPRLSVIPAGGFVIPASHITSDVPSVVDETLMPEEVHAQGFVESESAVDLGAIPGTSDDVDSAVDHGTQPGGTNASVADVPADSEHLNNIGEFEFCTPCILLMIACCIHIYIYIYLDLVMPHQMFRGLDYIGWYVLIDLVTSCSCHSIDLVDIVWNVILLT
jgi:hypothetical protein